MGLASDDDDDDDDDDAISFRTIMLYLHSDAFVCFLFVGSFHSILSKGVHRARAEHQRFVGGLSMGRKGDYIFVRYFQLHLQSINLLND